jgi:DNA-binding response OmpR family regulator
VDNFILGLRKILEPDPARPRHILTAYGRGYRLVLEPEEA